MMGAPVMGAPMMGAPVMGAPVMGAPMMGAPVMGAPMMGMPPTFAMYTGGPIPAGYRVCKHGRVKPIGYSKKMYRRRW